MICREDHFTVKFSAFCLGLILFFLPDMFEHRGTIQMFAPRANCSKQKHCSIQYIHIITEAWLVVYCQSRLLNFKRVFINVGRRNMQSR